MPAQTQPDAEPESVLRRHIRILECFDAWHPYRTLTEIALATGLPRSSVHRLLRDLEREGLIERLPDRSYRLGVRLWEFASRTPGAIGLREVARPWLGAVHERVRQHVQLGVRSARDVLFVERLSARDAVVNATLLGGRIPLPLSSSGLALLAWAEPAVIDDVVAGGFEPVTDRGIRTPAQLHAALARVRRDGYAVADGFIHPESRGIAVPVEGPDATVYAAIGVVVANDDSPPTPYVELLRRAAAGIARDLRRAYRPDAHEHALRALLTGSRRSLEYLEGLPEAGARS